MISFKEFVLEGLPSNVSKSWTETDISEEDAIAWLKENCSNLTENSKFDGEMIYRGFSHTASIGQMKLIDSSSGKRTSRDTDGFYQQMMDASKSMKNIPSRSNSFICSNDQITAEQYGKCYYVFPKRGTKIAVCDTDDFIKADVPKNFYSSGAAGLGSELAASASRFGMRIAYLLDTHLDDLADRNLDAELKGLNISNVSILDTLKITKQEARNAILKNANAGLFTAICSYLFTPEGLGIDMIRYGDALPNDDAELWFSGKALIMDMTTYATLKKAKKI